MPLAVACALLPAVAEGAQVRIQDVAPPSPPGAGAQVHRYGTGTPTWEPALTNAPQSILQPGDQLAVTDIGRAAVLWTDNSTIRLGRGGLLAIPQVTQAGVLARILKGIAYFFDRDKPGTLQVETPTISLAVRGTAFAIEVNADGSARVGVIEGQVEVSGGGSTLLLTNGYGVTVSQGGVLGPAIQIDSNSTIQWCLYYPGVLCLNDLRLSESETRKLKESLEAYQTGDLLGALAQCPASTNNDSNDEKAYRAALWLSVGQVDRCTQLLDQIEASSRTDDRLIRITEALREVISAVKHEYWQRQSEPRLATEWLAESYYRQSRISDPESTNRLEWERRLYGERHYRDQGLRDALKAAQTACEVAPDCGFVWERRAELEFSFGETRLAEASLARILGPELRNAQAYALQGFLAAARNRWAEAEGHFGTAIELDGGLANGWLGLGLVRIRQGRIEEGRRYLQMAATVEPQRSLLRSYLAKAFYEAAVSKNPVDTVKWLIGRARLKRDIIQNATNELALARQLDSQDPTPLLYLALINHEEHRINEAIGALEQSSELNDNRALFRSQMLLDQDHAVRSSSLAEVYRADGMADVSLREAARAISYDYGNYSAHQFLSESFGALRDPTRFNLRYETPWFNELLLANLLAPVGGTPLSQHVSQQEYSRLFDRDRFGLTSSTEYRSDHQLHQEASQYGTMGNLGWSLDLDYHHNEGIRPNNDLNSIEWYSTVKAQMTPQDSIMLLTKYEDYHSGDNFQYYNPANARPAFDFMESQTPILFGGYHHEWQPGAHTLVLGGRIETDQQFSDKSTPQTLVFRDLSLDPSGQIITRVQPVNLDVQHRIQLEIYGAEIQQILENERHALVVGGRWQGGDFDTHSTQINPLGPTPTFPTNQLSQHSVDDFQRASGYLYETLKLPGRLRLIGGLVCEYLEFPENFRSPPIQRGQETRERINPKAALVWDPIPQATIRGAYAQSLGGVSLDESFRLEPTQLAGFSQAFRSVVPESLVGSVSGADDEIWGVALDLKFKTGTYVGLQGQSLNSEVSQSVGVFNRFYNDPALPPGVARIEPSGTAQHLNYDLQSAGIGISQLIGEEWSLGAQYYFTRSKLIAAFPDLVFQPSTSQAHLHRINLQLLYNHPSGFFARAESLWFFERSSIAVVVAGELPQSVPSETFQQLNIFVGYRLPRQRGEFSLGVLNATGGDYRLNPVIPYSDLPRKAVFYARLQIRF